MQNGATIVSGALNGLQVALDSAGLEPAALGHQSDVPAAAWRDPSCEISLPAFVQVYENGAALLDRHGIGWDTGPLLDLADLGELGEALLSASTVGAALKTFERFIRCVQGETDLRVVVADGVATVTYRILNPDIWPRRQDAEFTLSVILALIRRGAGADWAPELLCFEHLPARAPSGVMRAAGCLCQFDCETNALSFPESVLSLAMPASRTGNHRQVLARLSRDAADLTRAKSVAARTRTAIFETLGTGVSGQENIARRLGLSRRSLHRHLAEEGTRFSDILDNCRFRIARHALVDTTHALARIACELDYSDQSAFERAFKRCTGMTPNKYRHMLRR